MSPTPRVLVATAGNVFLGDDGFGPEVARRLATTTLPEGVEVRDYGIAGLHLAYDLLDGVGTLLLVDTVSRGEPPGALVVLEVDGDDVREGQLSTHGMDPATVLGTLRTLGGRVPRTLVLGCEPADVDERFGLSDTVAAAVDGAVVMVHDLVAAELDGADGREA
jgi:hydrogenase maturation protease